MPKVSGLIVPKLCHTRHDGNIRCLEPVAPSAHHHDYGRCEYEEAQDKEEPEESLGIVTEVTAIIFLVAFLNLPAFLDKHGIDLTDILLHLANHPFVALKAAKDQAIARSHRIGQQRPVFVYRFVSENTLEEQILSLQQRKQSLIDSVMPFIVPR